MPLDFLLAKSKTGFGAYHATVAYIFVVQTLNISCQTHAVSKVVAFVLPGAAIAAALFSTAAVSINKT